MIDSSLREAKNTTSVENFFWYLNHQNHLEKEEEGKKKKKWNNIQRSFLEVEGEKDGKN